MQCVDIAEQLLAPEAGQDPELEAHIADCARCSHVAQALGRLDGLMRSSVVVAPPLDLQRRLAQLALEAAVPKALPWWMRIPQVVREWSIGEWLSQRPQMVAAQGLAAVMVALASWQIFGWLAAVQPVVGDVGYAMELVVGSPAAAYLGSIQIDFQSLGVWSLIGIGGWLVSEDGLVGRRIAASGRRLP
jgi:hypothetical protein